MKVESQFNPLPQMNTEVSKRDKALDKIATAVEVGMQESASSSIVDMLQSQISTMSQGLMNGNDAISIMQIAGGTLNALNDQAQTLNDLSVRYSSASLNESQKQGLQSEFNRTIESMQQSITSSSFNGKSIFGSNPTFSMGDSSISASIPELSPTALAIDKPNSIEIYRDALTQAGSEIGSTTNTLIHASSTLLEQIAATSAAKSQLADTDMANTIKNFQQGNLKLDVSQIALAHQNDLLRQNVTRLLG